MNISTLLGLILGFATLIVGLILKGANINALLNPAAIVIIFVGTFAALLNAFPISAIKKLPSYFALLFKNTSHDDKVELAREFINMAQVARREGALALEHMEFSNPFIKSAINMLVDGVEPQIIQKVMEEHVSAMEERHRLGSQMFVQAGTYAPTLGVLGAVIGLVAALGHLDDINALGHSIAAAFVATLFGIFSGYVLWHPFANKLKQMSEEEMEVRQMIIAGVLSIQAGHSVFVIQEIMIAYIPEKERGKLYEEWGR